MAVASAVSLALVGAASAGAGNSTRIVVYSPFTINGDLAAGVKVVKIARGSCFIGSLNSRRSDAWRCESGNAILDPCFSGGGASNVACPQPSDTRVLLLKLTQPLPKKNANPPLNTQRVVSNETTTTSGR